MAATKRFGMNLSVINGIPMNCCISQQKVDELVNFELYPSDLFLVTYPKSGTTWIQHIVKLILSNGVDNSIPLIHSCPWIEAIDHMRKTFMGEPPLDLKV